MPTLRFSTLGDLAVAFAGPTPNDQMNYLIPLSAFRGIADGFEPSIVCARKRVWVRFANYATRKARRGRRRKWTVYSLFLSVF